MYSRVKIVVLNGEDVEFKKRDYADNGLDLVITDGWVTVTNEYGTGYSFPSHAIKAVEHDKIRQPRGW